MRVDHRRRRTVSVRAVVAYSALLLRWSSSASNAHVLQGSGNTASERSAARMTTTSHAARGFPAPPPHAVCTHSRPAGSVSALHVASSFDLTAVRRGRASKVKGRSVSVRWGRTPLPRRDGPRGRSIDRCFERFEFCLYMFALRLPRAPCGCLALLDSICAVSLWGAPTSAARRAPGLKCSAGRPSQRRGGNVQRLWRRRLSKRALLNEDWQQHGLAMAIEEAMPPSRSRPTTGVPSSA